MKTTGVELKEYTKAHRRKKKWVTAVTSLACVVVFCTVYALILPAITLEKTAYCGYEEHAHTEECYQETLTCGLEEGESHVHGEECYETQTVLACELEESEGHTHSETCCDEDGNLVCALEESEGHTHTEDCYSTESILICEQEESEAHTHTEECYEQTLICELEEHEHTLSCYSNPEADVETAEDWEKTLKDVELTGIWADDLLAIAETQLGYTESTDNYQVIDEEAGTVKGYTRYGAWYGMPYEDWCAMFVSFCLNYADIPTEAVPRSASCPRWIEMLSGQYAGYEDYDLYIAAGDYIPNPGDLIFFDWDGDGSSDHVGIVVEYTEAVYNSDGTEKTPAQVKTIEGNSDDKVQYVTYDANDGKIMGYAMLPENVKVLTAEGEDYTITVTYGPDAELPEDVTLAVSEYAQDSETYLARYAEAAELYGWAEDEDDNGDFRLFDIALYAGEEEAEPAAPVQVTITFLEDAVDEDRTVTHFSDEDGAEPETLEAVSTYDYENDVQTVEFAAESFSDYAVSAANPQYTIQHYLQFSQVVVSDTAGSSGTWLPFINTSSNTTAKTLYDEVSSTNWSLTSAGLENGATESSLNVFYAKLNDDGSLAAETDYTAIFQDETALYKSKPQLQFMSRMYNDEDDYNKNYKLEAVWVYQPDESGNLPDDLDEADGWVKYKITTDDSGKRDYTTQIHFTNNPQNEKLTDTDKTDSDGYVTADSTSEEYPYKYTVLIQSNTVVRLVYSATTGDYDSEVNFFDYDITDGYVYSSASDAASQTNRIATSTTINDTTTIYYANSTASGINSASNYSDSGQYYAFGNTNAGTGLGLLLWNGNAINAANQNKNNSDHDTYKGLTFGMVSGLTTGSQGLPRLSFSSGISAPDLFGADDSNDGVTGKTSYVDGQYSLSFARVGGTYTLSSVVKTSDNTTVASNLTKFRNTTGTIMSNEFWPMDGAASHGTDGHDLLFGSKLRSSAGGLARYGTSDNEIFPISDVAYGQAAGTDSYNHNAYFGMSYSVEFTLKPGYCAPLTYWFYGDDDMWVFLQEVDENGNGTEAQLIADVGGVHSSVGEYVNLWDYIDYIDYEDEDGSANSNQTYRLTIFYTERGASGSTCYIRFVLPLDTHELTNEATDQSIVIEKELINDEGNVVAYNDYENEEFEFLLLLWDDNDQPTYDMYDYTIYNRVSDGADIIAKTGTIASSTNGNTFKLKGGQYLVISGLYTDRYFIVTEQGSNISSYLTSIQLGKYDSETGAISSLQEATYDNSSEADAKRTSTSNYNYVLFTNSPAKKTEISPGNEEGVNVGEKITYEIQWANDTGENGASVTVTDVLDEGVDFVAADFRSTTTIGNDNWQLTASDSDTGTLTYTGTAASDGSVTYGTITYDPDERTVTWTLSADTRAAGVVSLKVKVNEKGLNLAENETVATVDNRAKVTINKNELTTNWVTNPVWEPVKTEPKPGAGETVEYEKQVIYQVTWKNFLLESATVSVRDPLDKGVDYVENSAKAYIYDSSGTAVEMTDVTISYDSEKHQLTWDLGTQASGAYGYVEFTVKVNAAGVQQDKITNQGFVTVGNRDELETNIIENPTPRVTLTINKVDESGNALTGAEFRLYYRTESGTSMYYSYDSDKETVSWTEEQEYVISGNNMTAYELVPGMTYFLEETKAPDGYNLLAGPVKVIVASNGTVSIQYNGTTYSTSSTSTETASWAVSQDSSNKFLWTITVPNSSGYTLPNTGGAGTNLFTIGGLAMMAAAVGFGCRLRRRRGRRSGI